MKISIASSSELFLSRLVVCNSLDDEIRSGTLSKSKLDH